MNDELYGQYSHKEKNFVSAVIYVHNDSGRIADFLKAVAGVLEEHFEHAEIICVDDASDDGSAACIKECVPASGCISVSVLRMSYFHGLEMAMNAGVDLAVGDFIFEFDTAFMDFDRQEMMRIYKRSLEGYDIVSASADVSQGFASTSFYRLFDCFSGLSYQMRTVSFWILSRRAVNRVAGMNRTVPYRKAAYVNCGLKTDHMVYKTQPADSKQMPADKMERKYKKGLAVDVLILFTNAGYRFSAVMTVLMMLAAVFMTAYSIATYLGSSPTEGWTTTILFLSAAFFGLFGILTIIIKYLQLIVDLIFKRKRYSFESIEKLSGKENCDLGIGGILGTQKSGRRE